MKPPSASAHPLLALLASGLGAFILLVALDVISPEPGSVHAPRWVLGLCGVVFIAAGGALCGPHRPLLRKLSLSLLLLAMGGVAAWAASAPAEGWSGGLPFLPDAVNVGIARGLAGFGAVLCLGLLLYGWKTGFRSAREGASRRGRSAP